MTQTMLGQGGGGTAGSGSGGGSLISVWDESCVLSLSKSSSC